MNSQTVSPSGKRALAVVYLRLSLVLAFFFSLPFWLPSYGDVFHLVVFLEAGTIGSEVQSSLIYGLVYALAFMIIPYLGFRAFRDERRLSLQMSYHRDFLAVGVISVLWGALHVWNASALYSRSMTEAGGLDIVDMGNSLLTIFGSYAILVGLPWIVSGVFFLILAYKDLPRV